MLNGKHIGYLTEVFGNVCGGFGAHLTTIVICFAVAPYTRPAHAGYRFLALAAGNIQRQRPG